MGDPVIVCPKALEALIRRVSQEVPGPRVAQEVVRRLMAGRTPRRRAARQVAQEAAAQVSAEVDEMAMQRVMRRIREQGVG